MAVRTAPAPERDADADGDGSGDFRTLPHKVAEELRRRILLGDFAPGATLPERETSAELGVSRTPLREAIRILASEGLIEIRPARSPLVADPSAEELSQLFSVLRVLEALAAELTCLNAGAEQIAGIRERLDAQRAVDAEADPVGFFTADMAFHAAIVAAAGNPPLSKTHTEYNARLWRARFLTASVRTDRERILREHGEILSGIEARDTRWASAVMDAHLRTANRKILSIYARARATGHPVDAPHAAP